MSNSQPTVTGDPSTYQPKQAPQPASTRLSDGGATVTEGGPAPFVQPPARPGNPAGVDKPFRVGGG